MASTTGDGDFGHRSLYTPPEIETVAMEPLYHNFSAATLAAANDDSAQRLKPWERLAVLLPRLV